MLLSVIIPVFNERQTLGAILEIVAKCLPNVNKEIIVVEDCSRDGTREWLKNNFPEGPQTGSTIDLDAEGQLLFNRQPGPSTVTIRPIFHEKNKGKGGALQTGFSAFSGDILIIQDADLEYDPTDWMQMYDLIAKRKVADVVYGSRFYGRPHRSLYFHHYLDGRPGRKPISNSSCAGSGAVDTQHRCAMAHAAAKLSELQNCASTLSNLVLPRDFASGFDRRC